MIFTTPDDVSQVINIDKITMDINMLVSNQTKLQTIHNHTSIALKEHDIETYLSKVIAKAYFKFLTKHEDISYD